MNKLFTIISACLISALATIVGVFAGGSPLRVLLLPGKWFIKRFGFEGGPPEEGALYGLTVNFVTLFLMAVILLTVLRHALRRM